MKPVFKVLTLTTILWLAAALGFSGSCLGKIATGKAAPLFSGQDIHGKGHNLAAMKARPMVILYFFDAASRSSRDGLMSLNRLAGQFKDADLTVWGITRSARAEVTAFISEANLIFPVIPDTSGISELYQISKVLPFVYILGPELRILDQFQGGGEYLEMMLVRLAERSLQRRKTQFAKSISREVEKQNPSNTEAKTVRAYAAVEEGDLETAEAVAHEIAREKGRGEILAKEIQATVCAQKGDVKKALEMVGELEKKAPQRVQAHRIRADILYQQNKRKAARAEYQKGVEKTEGMIFQKAEARNQFGRFFASVEDYKTARKFYDQAVAIDPYYIEATSNKGVAYEKEGQWDKALAAYRQALSVNQGDVFTRVLAQKAQEMLALQRNAQKKRRIDKLVKELAARYRAQKKEDGKAEIDTWTSRPMILTFVDFQEKGGLSERDGFATVLAVQLGDRLNASGRVQVVERVLMERLLEELNLGSSELADPNTALRLGKVLAAKLIGTGSLYHLPQGSLLNMRVIDTETSKIPKVITRQFGPQADLEKDLNRLNRELLKSVIQTYPLQGYIVQVEGGQALINLGSGQGVVLGTEFEVLGAATAIQYKGKTLKGMAKPVARIKVVSVEPDFSYARIVSQERLPQRDDKIREKLKAF